MNNYEKLVDKIKHTDTTQRQNNFTMLKSVRTSKAIRDGLLAISKDMDIPYSKTARYAVRTLKNNIPVLTYKKILNNKIVPIKSNVDYKDIRYRFKIDKELDELLELRKNQLKTSKEELINLVVFLAIQDYNSAYQKQLNFA